MAIRADELIKAGLAFELAGGGCVVAKSRDDCRAAFRLAEASKGQGGSLDDAAFRGWAAKRARESGVLLPSGGVDGPPRGPLTEVDASMLRFRTAAAARLGTADSRKSALLRKAMGYDRQARQLADPGLRSGYEELARKCRREAGNA